MISLGGVTLHRGVFWANQHSTPKIAQDVFTDLDGGVCIQSLQLTGGAPIILEAEGSDSGGRGYFSKSFLDQVEGWELTSQSLTFIYGGITKTVMVPKNPLSVTPLRKMYGHTNNDIYYGTITLMEVAS